ncbi:hypothetical protein O181_034789 [Austropuccinia psidii MF-1]|uniref:Uncharacterized protein n=1 Tax=Austropuccinia psidii MF-1 TaxID=1389203 RepID=A0A9Q3D1I2_9BASI|nr:hypothetical protein [Austropuccinia psidii MF-1]
MALYGLKSVGHLGPFWPNLNKAKKGPRGQSLSPNTRWGRPEPVFGPELAKKALGPLWTPFSSMASGNPQRPPASQIHSSPQLKGKIFPFLHAPRTQGCRDGIIYHYAPFFLSNPMVTLSGSISMTPNQGPQIPLPISKEDSSAHQSGNHGGYQKIISGPQPPGPAGVGLAILPGSFQGPFSEVIHHSISCQGSKYFNAPWKTQLIHTSSNQSTCTSLA